MSTITVYFKLVLLRIAIYLLNASKEAISPEDANYTSKTNFRIRKHQKVINDAFNRINIRYLFLNWQVLKVKKGETRDRFLVGYFYNPKNSVIEIRVGRNYENIPKNLIDSSSQRLIDLKRESKWDRNARIDSNWRTSFILERMKNLNNRNEILTKQSRTAQREIKAEAKRQQKQQKKLKRYLTGSKDNKAA